MRETVPRVERASRGSTEVLRECTVVGEEALPGAAPGWCFHLSPLSPETAERSSRKERLNEDGACSSSSPARRDNTENPGNLCHSPRMESRLRALRRAMRMHTNNDLLKSNALFSPWRLRERTRSAGPVAREKPSSSRSRAKAFPDNRPFRFLDS